VSSAGGIALELNSITKLRNDPSVTAYQTPNKSNPFPTTPCTSLEIPTQGFYNYKASVVRFHRTTKRQNKKGICQENSEFQDFNPVLNKFPRFPTSLLKESQFSLSVRSLNELFESTKTPLAGAFNQIRDGRALARAITPNICVSLGLRDVKPAVWMGLSYVGRMLDKQTIQIDVPLLAQEVKDQLRGLPVVCKE